MNEALVNLAIGEVPAIIERIRELWVASHPTAPPPTNAEVITAYQSAFVSSLARDDRWLAVHPAP